MRTSPLRHPSNSRLLLRQPFRAGRVAFSLVELLSAIAIIAILAALAFAMASKAITMADRTREVGAARFLIQAYIMASNDSNGGILIPGRADYDERTGEGISYNVDEFGNELTAYQNSVWTHRVRPYLGERFLSTLFINDQEKFWHRINDTSMYDVHARYHPTFGMNERFVGGGSVHYDKYPPPIARFEEASQPANLVVFASATNHRPAPSVYEHAGWYRVEAPLSGRWVNESGKGGPANAHEALDGQYGFIAYRYNLSAVVAFLGGNVDLKSYDELRDMRLWSNNARLENNPRYSPGYIE